MTIGRGIAWIYDHMTRWANEEEHDLIDAALGDQRAQTRVHARRRQDAELADVEVA